MISVDQRRVAWLSFQILQEGVHLLARKDRFIQHAVGASDLQLEAGAQ
jgi:hypothetical protein